MERQVPEHDRFVLAPRARRHAVVIPVVNEGPRLAALLERMHAIGTRDRVDIVVADGGSTDGSVDPERLRALGVRALLVNRGPRGLSAQLRCAYAFVLDEAYDGVVTIDGNGKDDPAAIPAFVDALEGGVDFAQASRFIPGGMAENTPPMRTLAIRAVHAPVLSLASGFRWTDTTQGFRAYSSRLLRDPAVAPFRDAFVRYELLAYLSARAPRLGYRCVELPTRRAYPPGRVPTKISPVRGYANLLATLMRAAFRAYDP